MKNISPNLQNHLNSKVTTLATCIKITTKDGANKGYTTLDSNLIIDGLLYSANSGFSANSFLDENYAKNANANFLIGISSNDITQEDLLSGKYEGALIEIFIVNYLSLADGKINLRQGALGKFALNKNNKDGFFEAEIYGVSKKLENVYGKIYSPNCRANFGDSKCGINLQNHKTSTTISSVISNTEFFVSSTSFLSGEFDFGFVQFSSGNKMEINKCYLGGKITLMLPVSFIINVGDSVDIFKGCNKSVQMCSERYANIINFRAEPYVPGIDKIVNG